MVVYNEEAGVEGSFGFRDFTLSLAVFLPKSVRNAGFGPPEVQRYISLENGGKI